VLVELHGASLGRTRRRLRAFDVVAPYDKENRKLRMEAVLTPELVSAQEKPRPPREAVGEIFHSGGRI
jgi:hypothetical protein